MIKCPKCGSEKISKFGSVPTVSRGVIQRYRCHRGHTLYATKDYQKRKR